MTAPTGITRVTPAQRPAPGVEIEGRHQLHAVFFSAGGGRVQFFVRSERRRIAPDRRRPCLGGISVRGRGGAQPDLGARIRNQVLDAYRVSPAPANSLFVAKVLGNFIFVSVLEALMTPLFIVFYRLRALGPAWQLLLVAALGTWALVVNGTFFAAMSLRTRSREIMLPLLLFPISIPALLAMVQATTAILNGEGARFWIVLLVTYDLVFTTVCLLLFETVLNAE
jgi:hypothetical protein